MLTELTCQDKGINQTEWNIPFKIIKGFVCVNLTNELKINSFMGTLVKTEEDKK